jgi:hypothetical protein
MVLRRNKGVTSNVNQSVQSAHCPSCGAPEADLASHGCEFCGAVLNQGRYGWVLEQYLPWSVPEARHWRQRAADDSSAKLEAIVGSRASESLGVGSDSKLEGIIDTLAQEPRDTRSDIDPLDSLTWIIKVLAADRKMHAREKDELIKYAEKNSISSKVVQSLLSDAKRAGLEAPVPPNPQTARRWLADMVDMALVDGEISKDEGRVLVEVGRSAGLAS